MRCSSKSTLSSPKTIKFIAHIEWGIVGFASLGTYSVLCIITSCFRRSGLYFITVLWLGFYLLQVYKEETVFLGTKRRKTLFFLYI